MPSQPGCPRKFLLCLAFAEGSSQRGHRRDTGLVLEDRKDRPGEDTDPDPQERVLAEVVDCNNGCCCILMVQTDNSLAALEAETCREVDSAGKVYCDM